MFKVNSKDTRTTSLTWLWCFYCQLWTYFTHFSSVSVVNFEQVAEHEQENDCWERWNVRYSIQTLDSKFEDWGKISSLI